MLGEFQIWNDLLLQHLTAYCFFFLPVTTKVAILRCNFLFASFLNLKKENLLNIVMLRDLVPSRNVCRPWPLPLRLTSSRPRQFSTVAKAMVEQKTSFKTRVCLILKVKCYLLEMTLLVFIYLYISLIFMLTIQTLFEKYFW